MTQHIGKVVVIGAGMGGLAAAMRLAHAGAEVDLVEAHAAPGGKMRTVPSAAGPVDAGPTVLTMRSVFDDLFAAAGARLDDVVTLVRAPVLARHIWSDGSVLDLRDDLAANVAAIADFAGPAEAAAFEAFCGRARRLFEGFDAPVMQAPAPSLGALIRHVVARPHLAGDMAGPLSLAALLARTFRDPRLRQLFGRYATYVGGAPDRVPALLSLIWHSEAQGVWAVKGGMHALAVAMADTARARGARLSYGVPVDRILCRDGRAAGVVLGDGRRIDADAIVFNGDPAALNTGVLGPDVATAVGRQGVRPRSLSACVPAFAATPSRGDLLHHTIFFGDDPASEFADLADGRTPRDPTLYVCAQDRAGGARPEGAERFEIIMNAPPGADMNEEPHQCLDRILTRLARFGLTFDPPPGPEALTMPDRFAQLFPGSAGALYGRSPHGMMAAFRRPTARSRIPGLYLAGGGVHPGPGIPMATLSGAHAAAAIMSDRVSTSPSRRTAMPGGTSMRSPTTAAAPSPSSGS